MKVEVARWAPDTKNKVVGYAAFVIDGLIEIRNCVVRNGKKGELWVALPSRPYKITENGEEKTKYENHVGFREKDDYWEFHNKATALIETELAGATPPTPETPEAFDDVPF